MLMPQQTGQGVNVQPVLQLKVRERVPACMRRHSYILPHIDRSRRLLHHLCDGFLRHRLAAIGQEEVGLRRCVLHLKVVVPRNAVLHQHSTVFHELTHSTGHEKRLNRLNRAAFFGTEDYSKEELVAEIGAATLVNHVGLETSSSLRNNAAYIQNWLKVLKDDKRFIVSAAGRAEKAVNLILNQ